MKRTILVFQGCKKNQYNREDNQKKRGRKIN